MFCRNCGASTDDNAQFCIRCGASLQPGGTDVPPPGATAGATPPPPTPGPSPYVPPPGVVPKQKLIAALLGIFLGVLGIHRFYLGYNGIGAVQLVLGLAGIFTCGITSIASFIWGVVDGVLILTGNIATDAQGIPLRD